MGFGPVINDHGDIAFRRVVYKGKGSYQSFLYKNGVIWQITNDHNVKWNRISDLNNRGEFVLVTGDIGELQIKYGRLIR